MGFNTPTTDPYAPTRSSQNVIDKRADRPYKKHVTPNRIRLLPLLNRRGWKQPVLKNVCTTCEMFCYTHTHTHTHTHYMHNRTLRKL